MKRSILRFLLLGIFAFWSGATTWAQDLPTLTFLTSSHDFGKVKEAGGPISFTFNFVNTGKTPVRILSARPSCGCTTSGWTKSEVQPADTGYIKVQYNPFNRPGSFDKSVTVTTNGDPSVKILRIKGYVEPKPKTPADDFPTELGKIRMESRFINFGTITTKGPVTEKVKMYNQSEDTVRFADRIVGGDFISAKVEPSNIPPHKMANLVLTYDAKKRNDLGFVNDNIILFTNELENSAKSLTVLATIVEYFPPMTEKELAKAPHLRLDEEEYDFGKISEGDKVSKTFTFKNTGKSDLNIRRVKTNCGCTVSELDKKDYKPGETGSLKVTFNSRSRRGPQIKRISIFSNDPTAPAQDVVIKSYVVVQEKGD